MMTETPTTSRTEDTSPGWQSAPHGSQQPERPERARTWPQRAAAGVAVVALALGGGAAGAALVVRSDDPATATKPAGVNLVAGTDSGASSTGAGTLADVAARVQPSVVSIGVESPGGSGEGSGVVLRADGMILTNNHVTRGAGGSPTYTVTFSDGTTADATLVGADPATDLAVLQAKGVKDLAPATFAGRNDLSVGDSVLAVGSPLGLQGSVTSGIVSALQRSVDLGTAADGTPTVLADAIQTDAAINPGNSGGALVDVSGRVVGINTAIASLGGGSGSSGSIGLGFAIPVTTAVPVAESLMRGEQPAHAVLGVTVSTTADGALVRSVSPGGGAEAGGVRLGDVITAVDGRAVGRNASLPGLVRAAKPGDTVTLTIQRGTEELELDVTLGGATA